MKQSVIICNKYGLYELPHELPNDIRLRKLDYAQDIFTNGQAWAPTQEKSNLGN